MPKRPPVVGAAALEPKSPPVGAPIVGPPNKLPPEKTDEPLVPAAVEAGANLNPKPEVAVEVFPNNDVVPAVAVVEKLIKPLVSVAFFSSLGFAASVTVEEKSPPLN